MTKPSRRNTLKKLKSAKPVNRSGVRRLRTPLSQDKLAELETGWNDRFYVQPPLVPRPQHLPQLRSIVHQTRVDSSESLQDDVTCKLNQSDKKDGSQLSETKRCLTKPRKTRKAAADIRLIPLQDAATSAKYVTEEMVKKKVLKAIRVREKLVTSLHKFVSSPSSQTKSTGMAQELAAYLQDAGVECVEALVEWMLIKGSQSSSTPVFLWRGEKYFSKMSRDLDFAIEALRGHGVKLIRTRGNALLIQPHQHVVDRVMAANAIIGEMTTLLQSPQKTNLPDLPKVDHKKTARSKGKQAVPELVKAGPCDRILTGFSNKLPKLSKESRALGSGQTNSTGIAKKPKEIRNENTTSELTEKEESDDDEYENDYEDLSGSNHEDEEVGLVSNKVSLASTCKSDLPTASAKQIVPPSGSKLMNRDMTEQFGQVNASVRLEYDQPHPAQARLFQEDVSLGCELLSLLDERDTILPLISSTPPNESSDKCVIETKTGGESKPSTVSVSDRGEKSSQLQKLNEILLKYSTTKEELTSPILFSTEALDREFDSDIVLSMFDYGSFDEWFGATVSVPAVLISHGLLRPSQLTRLEALLTSEVAKMLRVPEALHNQSNCIVNELFHGIASRLQSRTEMNFREVIEVADNLIGSFNMWEGIKDLLLLQNEHFSPPKKVAPGICELIHVFYPYLVDLPHRMLLSGCSEVFQLLLQSIDFEISRDNALIDSSCKRLHLNSSLSKELDELDRRGDAESTPTEKLIIMCDREDVLGSSMRAIIEAGGLRDRNLLAIAPYFKSKFGDKMIRSIHVEEGEGRGPLKEWFSLVSISFTQSWKLTENPLQVSGESDDEIVFEGNRLTCTTLRERLLPGIRLNWIDLDGHLRTCVINSITNSTTAVLDSSVCSKPMHIPVREVRFYQHTTPVLCYLQGSESVWFNRDLTDTAESRERLVFLGWFLANAIINLTRLDQIMIPIHFYNILYAQEAYNGHDLSDLANTINPDMVSALKKLEALPTKDFEEYLRLEGINDALTFGEYVSSVLESHFGAASNYQWQVQCIQHGFNITLPLSRLRSEHISSTSLHDMLHSALTSDSNSKSLREVFRVACDVAFAECEVLQQVFWKVVDAFDGTTQRKFIKFVTGVETFPLPGTEFLRIEMPFPDETSPELERVLFMLPQSHTCNNTLELPNYWKAIKWRHQRERADAKTEVEELGRELENLMRKKLLEAVDYSQGYSLDVTSNVSITEARNASTAAHVSADDSVESLHLMSLQDDTSF
uniref:HECT-type E3 ubiquitin transferase n=1 Tax=Albugo laibachii Nc14 TaxID=890382 RepID=F0W196_9STRA|nr:conserved hypothetical protein [Albugo laibachii Nc14]|eukprot:CCA14823.1 conserved hypothetical protein [Albugo laibachii Nc14]